MGGQLLVTGPTEGRRELCRTRVKDTQESLVGSKATPVGVRSIQVCFDLPASLIPALVGFGMISPLKADPLPRDFYD